MEFSPNALKYAPWSISKAESAKQCGLRFHWKYVEQIPEPKQAVRPESRIGSAAHKAMELVLHGEDIKRAFTVGAVDNKLTTKEVEELLTFTGTIQEFVKRVARFQEKRPSKKQFVEHKFGLTMALKPTTFFGDQVFFRGTWDYALHLQDNELVIFDHKSGQPPPPNPATGELDTSKYSNQLSMYALAGRLSLPSIKGVQSAIHFMRDGSIAWGAYITAEEIDEKLTKWFVEYLNDSVAALEKKGTPGWYCGFCGYAGKCPAYQERNK